MPVRDYDNLLVGEYIRSIENPDSIGFKDGKWFQSPRKVDDPNNRGFGVDIKYNDKARELVKGRKGKWLSEEEERDLRNSHIDYVMGRINKWTPQMLQEMPSEEKRAMAAGMLYRGDGIKNIIKNPALRDAFYSGTSEEFSKAVEDFYKDKNSNHYQPERARLHKEFMDKQPFNQLGFKVTEFKPDNSLFAKGGLLEPKDAWDRLSIPEKADIIKVGVRHGIFDLQELRRKYNEFKEEESKEEEEEVNTEKDYINTMERVAEENYRKWKHGEGGSLYKGGGIVGMPALPGISLRAAIAKRLYENTDALDGYDVGKFVTSVVTGDSSNNLKNTREHLKFKLSQDPSDNDITRRWKGELNQTDIADELYAQYLGIPVKDRHTKVRLSKSPYRSGSYRMPITNAEWDKIISETDDLNVGESTSTGVFRTAGLNTSAIGKGHDERGEYRSYGDSFDLNPFRGSAAIKDIPGLNKINDLSLGLFNPVEVYDRVYLDDYYGVPKEDRGGNYLPEIVITGKKKKALGGNLFDGEHWPTQHMQIGVKTPSVINFSTEQLLANAEKIEQQRKAMEEAIARRANNYLTTSNDAISVANGRPQNQHLVDKAIQGAKAHAAWEKEHPNLTAWSYLPSAAVIGTALAPLGAAGLSGISALGDAAAATPVGQGITNFLAPIATTSYAGATVPQWFDLGLTSGFGAHGVQTAIDEGGISPTTALELLPVTRVAKPAVEMGLQEAKEVIDNGSLWDAYTTFGGRFGNYGDNTLTNIYGTVARRFGLPDKARVPADAMRKIKGDIHVDNGAVDLTGNKPYLGNPHVNATLDRGVVSHSKGQWDGANTYITPTRNFIEQTQGSLKSIEPSDMFSNGVSVTESPRNVTLISGDIESLNKAREAGMQTLSSPRLRRIYQEEEAKYLADKAAFDEQYANASGMQRLLLKAPESPKYRRWWPEYTKEVQRLQAQRGTPTLADFGLLEQQTGLKSGVAPILEYDKAIRQLEAMKNASINDIMSGKVQPYVYPNGRIVDWDKAAEELELIRRAKYNNVFYDPASYVESDWQVANGVK